MKATAGCGVILLDKPTVVSIAMTDSYLEGHKFHIAENVDVTK